jgi:hypothetical protein
MMVEVFLKLNPQLKALLEKKEFYIVFNAAYEHIKNRLSLHPKFFKCTFTGGVDFNAPVPAGTGGYLQFKSITDIIGQTLVEDQPHGTINTPLIIFGENLGFSSEVELYFNHNYVYAPTSITQCTIPMIGYPYPPCLVKTDFVRYTPYATMTSDMQGDFYGMYIPDAIVFPLTAKMYSIVALNEQNIQLAGAYDALCNLYINMRNAGLANIVPKSMATATGVTPYALH